MIKKLTFHKTILKSYKGKFLLFNAAKNRKICKVANKGKKLKKRRPENPYEDTHTKSQ